MEPKFPLFVRARDSGELASFGSLHELQSHVERIDVENGEYEAWDSDGYRVELTLQKPVWLKLEIAEQVPQPDQFHLAFDEFARSVGIEIPSQLPSGSIAPTLAQVRAQYDKNALEGKPVRRFLSRFKHDRQ